jgi:hypothetical protein
MRCMTTLLAQLRDLMAAAFNDNDVRDLCFDLNIPYEDLGGEGRTAKARGLIAYCQSRNLLNALVARCRELRPNTEWPEDALLAAATLAPQMPQPASATAVALAAPGATATPLELALHFTSIGSGENAPLQVRVEVQKLGLSTEPHDFAIPLDDKVQADLRWYLEVYPQWPVGPDYDRALGIEAKLRAWGKALFDAAFADREVLRVYDEFRREKNVTHLITLDATDPRVLQLPWELLADEGGHLFAQRPPISIRRRLKKTKAAQTQEFTLPMRILFVVSRPEGAGFLDPRSSAQALLDAIEPLGDQTIVEFLYPPTLKALTQRVRDPQLPPVHVVHFDGHGVYVPATGLG